MSALDVVGDALLEGLEPLGLEALQDVADLQRRFDAKYVVPLDRLPDLVASLSTRMGVLEVDGRRVTTYRSVYFDTPDLRTYRDHLQQRRRRFKIRTRRYGGGTIATLEVKHKGRRGETVKDRWPHPGGPLDELSEAALGLVRHSLADAYGVEVPDGLGPAAVTSYERSTLADLAAGERVTIDRGLRVQVGSRRVELGGRHAVVEVKSASARGDALVALRGLGLQPASISKYCLAIAAADLELPANPWAAVLRQLAPGDG